MAKQTGAVTFTGKLGNMTGYYRKGKYVVRRVPEKVQQAAATKQAATDFGAISRRGKLIRQGIVPYLGVLPDGTVVTRLNKALILASKPQQASSPDPALQPYPLDEATATSRLITPRPLAPVKPAPVVHPDDHLRGLQGFRFNAETGIEQLLCLMPVFTKEGVLQIPAQALPAMRGATHLEIRTIGVRVNFAEQRIAEVREARAMADLAPEWLPSLELPLMAPGKDVLFVVLQLRACLVDRGMVYPLGNRRYMAADIITVMLPAAQLRRMVGGRKRMVKRVVRIKVRSMGAMG